MNNQQETIDYEAILEADGLPADLPVDPFCVLYNTIPRAEINELSAALAVADVEWDDLLGVITRHPREFRAFVRNTSLHS